MTYYNDDQLSEMEEAVRAAGYDVPIGWLLGFIQDYDLFLMERLKEYPTVLEKFKGIITWMKEGDSMERET